MKTWERSDANCSKGAKCKLQGLHAKLRQSTGIYGPSGGRNRDLRLAARMGAIYTVTRV